MRACPRCGVPTKPFRVLGMDLKSRLGFALSATLLLGAIDLSGIPFYLHILRQPPTEWFLMHTKIELWSIPLAALARFVLIYIFAWSLFLHVKHLPPEALRAGRGRKESIYLSIFIPAICFMTPVIIKPLIELIVQLFHPF